jgi:hypothetical protein
MNDLDDLYAEKSLEEGMIGEDKSESGKREKKTPTKEKANEI